MEIRPATFADLETLERLRLQTFSARAPNAVVLCAAGCAIAGALKHAAVHPKCPQGTLGGLGRRIFCNWWEPWPLAQPKPRCGLPGHTLAALRHLGLWPMMRYLGVWASTYYEPAPQEAYLYGIVVAPAYRRRGLAAELMNTAEAQYAGWGKQLATGFIERSNTPSLQMVQKLGYQRVEQQRNALRRILTPNPIFVRVEKPL